MDDYMKTRLEKLLKQYESDIKTLEELQWSIFRKRREIDDICKELNIEVKSTNEKK